MILLIDNYDSFTYNLVRYFEEINEQVLVVKNDEIDINGIIKLNPEAIVISPGPKTPNEAGISLETCEKLKGKIPILGVCLGHQIIAQVYGYEVTQADAPVHGKVSKITTTRKNLFNDLPSEFSVCRYHSLVVKDDDENNKLNIDARVSDSNEIMAISDTDNKVFGVQFHPEALLSEYGHEILNNFMMIVRGKNEN